MSISCAYECENKYKIDIEDCHYLFEVETVEFTNNALLIACIQNAYIKYHNCSKLRTCEYYMTSESKLSNS